MAISLSPEKLKRYKDIALLLMKYGRADVVEQANIKHHISEDELNSSDLEEGKPEELASDLEKLGPTYIKLGQLFSTRPDFLPQPYIEALSRLQDNVEPFPYEKVEEIVKEELGVRISKAFLEFREKPIAAASLGQVHYAVLRSGEEVAVKVQRPNIKEIILDDLDALEDIAALIDNHSEIGSHYKFKEMLDEFRKTILREIDYQQEAQNLVKLSDNLKKYKNILVPIPVSDYTTSKLLTMTYIKGTKITKISPLSRLELDGKVLAKDLFQAYLDQILVDGFFHADPHPGNVFLTVDNKIALIDLGMVAHIDPDLREKLLKLLLNVSEGRGKEAAKICLEFGTPLDDFDKPKFTRDISDFVTRYQDTSLEDIKVGNVIVELAGMAGENGLRTSPELIMLGKTLLNLDEVGKTLEPRFNPNEEVREYAQKLMQEQMMKNISPGNIFSSLLEANRFIQKLPGRLNAFLDQITENKFTIKVNAFNEDKLMKHLQKIANRITLGLILAALIVGAALMMNVNTEFRILGYPGVAMVLFLLAGIFGFGLVITILLHDKIPKKNLRK